MLTASCSGVTGVIPLLIALLSALAVSRVLSRAEARGGRRRAPWRLAAHALLGLGIWTTHCVGLLLCAPGAGHGLGRHLALNLTALLICVLAGLLALRPPRPPADRGAILYGRPLAMGLGLSAAHLLTLKAAGLRLDLTLESGARLLTVNLLASFVICAGLLSSRRAWNPTLIHRAGATVLLALGIAALHYGSLAAVSQISTAVPATLREVLSNQWLDALASLAALAVLSGGLFSASLDARRSRQTSSLVDSLTAANRELNRMAYHDPLTRLPNHSLFEEKLRIAIERARRDTRALILMLIDLDGFKAINKAFGHRQGDRMLADIAARIQAVVPRRCPMARVGGDEFVIMLDLDSSEDVVHLGSRILTAISQPLPVDGHDLTITASLGIARYPQDGTTARALIEHATMAMYHAKSGEEAYAFFEPAMTVLARDHLLLLSDLRQALPQRQLILHYQPIMRAPDGPMVAAEVLIRWQHPRRGLLLPEAFVGHAERAGLIVDIGNWVIDAACLQLRQWTDQGAAGMRLAINVSAIQLHYELLVDTLQAAVQRHRVDPSRLTLEFTESAAMKDPARSLAILQRLQRLGFRISLDDFGTGYSSLLYLKQLPASELKIDRSFVSEIDQLANDRTIVSAIVALAGQLQMSTVAEGVETPAQKQLLCELGCTYLQGYLLGAPVPAEQLPVPTATTTPE